MISDRSLLASAAPAVVHDVIHSAGRPLDPDTRAFFEPRFGFDLSRVRIHTDDHAAASARAVGAAAYTVGSSIVFGHGRYAPHLDKGRRLIAHELVHTIQQQGGSQPSSPDSRIALDAPASASEAEAGRIAASPDLATIGGISRGNTWTLQRLAEASGAGAAAEELAPPVSGVFQVVARGLVTVGGEVIPEATAVVTSTGAAAGGAGATGVGIGLGIVGAAAIVILGAIVVVGATYFVVKMIDEHKELDEYGGTLPPGGAPPQPLTGQIAVDNTPLGEGTFQPQTTTAPPVPSVAPPAPFQEPQTPPQADTQPRAQPSVKVWPRPNARPHAQVKERERDGPKHMGNIHTQGNDIDPRHVPNFSWNQGVPATKAQGLEGLNLVKGQCTRAQLEDREEAFDRAANFIQKSLVSVPPSPPVLRDWPGRKKTQHVDIEIIRGTAFA